MKRSRHLLTGWTLVLLLAAPLLLQGGAWGSTATTFQETIKAHNEPFDSRSVRQVRTVTQATVLAKEEGPSGTFRVLSRKQEIERFRCNNCHAKKETGANNAAVLTHGNIILRHGQEGMALTCIDCHHPEDREALEDKKGRKIDFDHSYQLCGQCHFRQKRDWLGGAHGKRVANWAGERVVYNCTSCHDPHSPRFAKRFPVIYSVPLK